MADESSEKRKVIIDEDWKSRVQAEKEALKQQAEGEPQPSPDTDASPADSGQPQLPEASFSVLITTLATQTLAALGQSVTPEGQRLPVDLKFAGHLIDTLAILEQKTKGNLTEEESRLLEQFLYELRMLFVAVKKQEAP